MIADFIEQVGAWAWWILGLILLVAEIVLPGTFFLWFGISAIVVGTVALLFEFAWEMQVVAFVVLAVVLAIVGRRFYGNRRQPDEQIGLNERALRLIGSTYILHEPISEGVGRIRVGDSTWRVVGPELQSGTRVKVVSADGTTLRVEPDPAV